MTIAMYQSILVMLLLLWLVYSSATQFLLQQHIDIKPLAIYMNTSVESKLKD